MMSDHNEEFEGSLFLHLQGRKLDRAADYEHGVQTPADPFHSYTKAQTEPQLVEALRHKPEGRGFHSR
jgi:hypothetical protein